jgi:peptidoglycan/LPS O-acetylase OafA/YrhL
MSESVEETAPARSAAVSVDAGNRLRSLDGLRGLAALIVVFTHLSLTLPTFSDKWIAPTAVHPPVGSFGWWFTSTPLQLTLAGDEAVLVFFVLSGLVLTLPVIRRANFDWIGYYPRRIARLWIPVAASVVLAVIWIVLTDQTAARASSLWVDEYSIHGLSWAQVLNSFDLIFGNISLNNPLWTIRWELLFSILLPVFVVVAIASRRLWWLVLLATIPAVLIGTYGHNGALMYFPVFLTGVVLAVKFREIDEWMRRHASSKRLRIGAIAVLIASLLLLDVHWTLWGLLGGAPRFQTAAHSLEFVGAFGLVFLAAFWRPVRGLLSTRFFRWLGRISFSLYLVHVPIVIAVDSVFNHQFTVLRILLSLALVLVAAVLFARFVEQPAHRFSRYLGAGASRAVSSFTSNSVR